MALIQTKHPRIGIAMRFALLSWLVALSTLLFFVLMTLPQQKRTFLENLESKANSVAVSLRDVAAGAAVNEDLASVVSASQTLLGGDPDLDFLIVTKNNGFSLINEQSGWRVEPETHPYWLPEKREPVGGIASVPTLNQRVFHYAQPFDYSGIQWGWIHVGLSLEGYDQSVASLYRNTVVLALGCIFLSFLVSLVYARQMVRPILRLRHLVEQIAGGDLSVKAHIKRHDELGSLADSVNTMTKALLRKDQILESVSFAAQQFMQTSQWENVVTPVLGKIGQAADASRAYIFENHTDRGGRLHVSQRHEWSSPDVTQQLLNPELQNLSYADIGFGKWPERLGRNEIITAMVSEMSTQERAVLEPQDIRSIIVIPIFVEGVWWGFMGLDDCLQERVWTDAEQDSLRAAADMLGATISRQKIQNALVIAKEGAEQASRSKSEFLANMSHELRTPLNHIIGFTDLVLSRSFGELTEEQDEFLKDVLGSSHHLLSLINDVLDLSKVEAGKMELELSEVRIRELLENSLVMVKEKALKNQLRLDVDLDGVPETFMADERKIKQVVYNLLSNAVKFTVAGGEVRLGARIQDRDGFKEHLLDPGGIEKWLCVWVVDTGIGLEPKDLARIFDPFEQVEGSTSRKYQGTGLGLALTRKMIELHSGVIWAESAGMDQGSTFKFVLPVLRKEF
ncbi:MAG: HAMP domain-containing protein [Proteobacteria bacterium]|nr:HAMP domain-containing protein [Pseudomonadota bacterium]MBU4469989.1 HAMP domain-containing protein [Pseudomonadota bacterium]MCG2753752.1 ATP-binding protein [Desulfobacteraceae bacterium]